MPERIDQTIQLNERQILKRVLNTDDTLAISDVDSSQPGYFLFDYTVETAMVDGLDVKLNVTTIREYSDPAHANLRRTVVIKKRGNRVFSLDNTIHNQIQTRQS